MYEQLLQQSGLTENEAIIYEILLQEGELKAGQIAQKTPLKRGLTYKTLQELEEKGLVERNEPPGKVAKFNAYHPAKLRDLANLKEKEVVSAKESIDQLLPQLSSAYNLAAGKPGVRFFEGLDGIKKVWWDSLTDTTEILTYGDLEFLAKHFATLNQEYLKQRKKRGIKKRALTNDSKFNRDFLKTYDDELTETKLLSKTPLDFSSVIVQIYNNKVSYTTLSQKTMIGVIIEDRLIYQMQKNLFEYQWHLLKEEGKNKNQFTMDNLEDFKNKPLS